MEISLISDAISSPTYLTHSLRFVNCFVNRSDNVISLADTSLNLPPRWPLSFHISAASPPPTRTITKRRTRRIRRVKRKISFDDGDENGFYVFGDDGWGSDHGGGGFFGSGGGGKGWNFGGPNWEDSSDNSISDPAFDFVYEILCWIAMSNCLNFAFKKVVRVIGDQLVIGKRVR